MNQPISSQQLDEIEARHKAATPGPWGSHRDLHGTYTIQARPRSTQHGFESEGDVATLAVGRSDAESYANARFIAHAPTDVAVLLAEVYRQRAELAATRAHLDAATRLAGRLETKLRGLGAPATVDVAAVEPASVSVRPVPASDAPTPHTGADTGSGGRTGRQTGDAGCAL